MSFEFQCICVLVFVFVLLYLYVLHPGAVPQWSLYPGLSKNIAHVWSIVSFYFRARINLLRGGGEGGGPKPIVNFARPSCLLHSGCGVDNLVERVILVKPVNLVILVKLEILVIVVIMVIMANLVNLVTMTIIVMVMLAEAVFCGLFHLFWANRQCHINVTCH